jgi:DNA repair exonuclease SbcCD ATPase subunit
MQELTEIKSKIHKYTIGYETALQSFQQYSEQLEEAQTKLENLELAKDAIQVVGEGIQRKAHSQIAGVVSECLQLVFEETYTFDIIFEKKRNKTEARLVFLKDGNEIDPLTASGGGVVDVAAFALRVSCLVLSKPKLRKVLVMDEPFRFVSEEYRENVQQVMEKLSTEFGIQMILVTHMKELISDKVVQL